MCDDASGPAGLSRICDAFPSIAARLPLAVAEAPVEAIAHDDVLSRVLPVAIALVNRCGDDPLALTRQVLQEIVDAKPLMTTGKGLGVLTLLQFAVATTGIGQCLLTGQIARAGDWVQASISDESSFGADNVSVEVETERVRLLVRNPPSPPGMTCDLVCEWSIEAFNYFRKMNAMSELAYVLEPWCIEAAMRSRDLSSAQLATDSLLAIAMWAAKENISLAASLARTLEEWYDRSICPLQIARGFMGSLAPYTRLKTEEAWARVTERDHWDQLDIMGRLAVKVSASVDPATYASRKAKIMELIGEIHKRALVHASPYQKALWLSSAFDAISPLVWRLAKFAAGLEVLELLSAWHGVERDYRLSHLLILIPATERGTLILWDNDSVIGSDSDLETFQGAVTDMNRALNLSFSFEGGDSEPYVPPIPERMGTAVQGSGESLLSAINAAYDLAGCREAGIPSLLPFITLNSMPLNVQSASLRILGYTWPNAVSLRRPLPDARIRRVGIWHGPLSRSDDEVTAICALFRGAGIEVFLEVSEGPDDRSRFEKLYSRSDLDVLWIIGHGEFVPYSTHLSSLRIFASGDITAEQLCNLQIAERSERRLLVLNVCNAGMVTGLGGLSTAGIAGLTTSPVQATVSHLWSADPIAAAVLGILLAAELAKGTSYFDSFLYAMNVIKEDNDAIADALHALGTPITFTATIREDTPINDFARSGSALFCE